MEINKASLCHVSQDFPSTDGSSDSSTGALAMDIARAMEQRGDLRGAKEAYRFAFELLHPTGDRSASEAAFGQGRVAEQMGELGEARGAYLKAAELARDDPPVAAGAWLGLAGVAERMGELDEARWAPESC